MPQWATLKTIYLQHTKGLTTGAHVKGPKKDICPKSRDGNIATHKVDISSLMKSSIEFCYGGGAREPLWAPRLLYGFDHDFKKCRFSNSIKSKTIYTISKISKSYIKDI